MSRDRSNTVRAVLTALVAIVGVGLSAVRGQDRPRVDWDTAAANTVMVLLKDDHLQRPQTKSKKVKIAVLGDDRFGKAVVALAKGKKTPGPNAAALHAVHVAEKDLIAKKASWSDADFVVLATDGKKVQTQVLAILAGKRALVIGRRRDLIASGGHVHLWLSDNKKSPRFQIALVSVRKLGFKVSSTAWKLSRRQPKGEK